ncbi:MAG: hypothetical protein ACTSR4_09220, partial [Candidatus Hodarchaeales archaeon]
VQAPPMVCWRNHTLESIVTCRVILKKLSSSSITPPPFTAFLTRQSLSLSQKIQQLSAPK